MPIDSQVRMKDKINFFTQQSDPRLFAKHIGGKLHRWRVGDYRIFFKLGENVLTIVKIERRDKAYK